MTASNNPPSRILVVDDREANLVAIREVLAPLGQPIVTATSGGEALRHLLHSDFAVILLDVQMPELDGIETARIIKLRERSRHTPIIFITAHGEEASRVLGGYATGAVDFLMKPLVPEILRSKVSVFVDLHQRGERIKRQACELTDYARAEEQARRQAELGQQLLAIVGHDLRSPLSTVRLTANLLRSRGLSERDAAAVERIVRSTHRIESIVDLLVDFTRARLGTGIPISRRESELTDLVRKVLDELAAEHPDRFELQAEDEPLIGLFDPDRIAQVVTNLVRNAIQHGAPDRPIRVTTRRAWDGTLELEVANAGEPIPPDLLARIFEPFVGTRPGEESRSLGLGLYIVRQIARAHGGNVRVRSTEEEGTMFTVSLPAQPQDQMSVPAAPSAPLPA